MKKPNITEGEWKSFGSIEPHGLPTEICRIGVSYYVMTDGDPCETAEQDAKAISAVPDMIDALIDLLGTAHDAINAHGYNPDEDESIIKAEQALKKAGCHDA